MDQEKGIERGVPLYQQAYVILKNKILTGTFRPGEVLAETLLAEDLGISRTPIREAIRQLEKDGLIKIRRYEVMISKPTREDFVELYLCRAALEQLVAERAALEATPADIETMTLALRQSEEAINRNDLLAVLTYNTQFHDKMVQSARILQLSRLMDSIRGPILLARRMVLAAGEVNERGILAEHWEILLAIQERNSRLTQDGMKRHMHNDLERGLAQFDSWERSYDNSE